MKDSAPHRRSVLFGLLLGGLCLWWCLRPHPPTTATMPLFDGADYASSGEALLHGIPAISDISHRMPLATLLSALLLDHSAVPWLRLRDLLRLGVVLLAVAVCGLLEGSAAAALAAAALVGWLVQTEPIALSELNCSLLTLLAAGMLAWRAQKPSLPRSLALGAAFGAVFLTRSTLCLFPPLLALWEWLAARKNPGRFAWRNALVVAVVPYLFLLPWLRLNWNLYRSFVPFEHNAPNLNIVTGVMGLVQTSGGDPRSLVPDLGPMEGGILLWALREISRHPGQYIAGCAQRLIFFFNLHPFLISLAALSVYLNRRRNDYRCLGLLATYFVAIHCTMSVTERYFTSLWPILAIVACAPLAVFARRTKPGAAAPAGPVAGYSSRFLIGALAFALVFVAYAIRTVNAYAQIVAGGHPDPHQVAGYDRAVSRYPQDPKLRSMRGQSRRRAGDLPGAEEDLALAAALQPENHKYSLELAFTRALRGDGSSLRDWRMPWSLTDADGRALRQRWRIYQAIVSVQRGEPASEHLRKALILNRYFVVPLVNESPSATLIETRIRGYDANFLGEVMSLSEGRPAAQRLALVRAVVALLPRSGLARLEEAILAALTGQRPQALQALRRARALGLGAENLPRADALLEDLTGSGPVRASAEPNHGRIGPMKTSDWMDFAEVAARSGKRQDAVRYLQRAEGQVSDLEAARRIAALYNSLGEDGRAKALLERLAGRWPKIASVSMDLADSAAKSKEPQAALEHLKRAGANLRDDAEKRRLAMLYQDAGRLNESYRLLNELVTAHPSQAAALHDRGVCLFLQGKRDAAIRDFRQALALDPHFAPARRSLDAVLGPVSPPASSR